MNSLISSITICLLLIGAGPTGSCRTKEASGSKEKMESKGKLSRGIWGGEHVRLEVTDKGATAEYDCATSTIDEPIILKDDGSFEAKGKFKSERSGPVTREDEDNSFPVLYTGSVVEDQLTLTIASADKKQAIGTYTLTRGSEGRLMKCR